MTEEMRKFPDFNFSGRELTTDEFSLLTACLTHKKEEILVQDSDFKNEFLVQVLLKRIEAYQLDFTFTDLFVLASFFFVDSPGNIMILL